MELQVFTNELSSEDNVADCPAIKFVVFEEDGMRVTRIANPAWVTHQQLIPEGVTAIGGGEFQASTKNPEWGSTTLNAKFNFDRPSDPEAANRVLNEVRELIQAWLLNK